MFEDAVDLCARRGLDVLEKAYALAGNVDVIALLAFVGRRVEEIGQRQDVGQIEKDRIQTFLQ